MLVSCRDINYVTKYFLITPCYTYAPLNICHPPNLLHRLPVSQDPSADPSLLTTGIHRYTHIPVNIPYKDRWVASSLLNTATHEPSHQHRCQYSLGPPVSIGHLHIYH